MPRSTDRAKLNVAWWSALLLLLLGSVFAGLFVAARLLLSLEREPARGALASPHFSQFDAARPARPPPD
jgi:uncharacterized membrane protein YesL